MKRSIYNEFDHLSEHLRDANDREIVEFTEILQLDEDLALLSKSCDNSSNQCDCLQN
jgi:hypothetical protein